MAIDLGSQTLSVAKQERTWRIECFCEDGADYELVAHREVITTDPNGVVISRERDKEVHRRVSQVAAQADAMQFLQLAKDLCDRWAQEDAAAIAASTPA